MGRQDNLDQGRKRIKASTLGLCAIGLAGMISLHQTALAQSQTPSNGQTPTSNQAPTQVKPTTPSLAQQINSLAVQAQQSLGLTPKPAPQLAPQGRPSVVDWAKAAVSSRRTQLSNRPNPLLKALPRPELDRTRLPVILPRAGGLIDASKGRLFSFGDAYSLNLPQKPGISIIVYGHRSLVTSQKGFLARLPVARVSGMSENVHIDKTEDGWTASFQRFGVVYSVDVSCDDAKASECQNEGFLSKAIAEFTDVSMGSEAQKEAQSAGVKL